MEHVTQTEQALIGAILQAPDKLVRVIDTVKPDDLLSMPAKTAFTLCIGLWKAKRTVDLVSVAAAAPELSTYLAESTSYGSPIGILDYAAAVAEKAKERRINSALQGVIADKRPLQARLDTILRLYQQEMFVVRKAPKIDKALERFQGVVTANKKRGMLGYATGIESLDRAYIQYVPGQIWVMGGFTSVGKTAVMVQKLAFLLSMEDCPRILVVSTEMTEEQLIARLIANFTGIHSQRILAGKVFQEEERIINNYQDFLATKPLLIYDDIYEGGEIETVFRMADLQGGVNIGFIDYVQNCTISGAKEGYSTGSTLAKRFQQMAKNVRCCLICLSQLSNDVGRGNTDQLEFKGAGEWGAVADVGILLDKNRKEEYKLRYKIKKNRHGKKLTVNFEYRADYTRIKEIYE